MPIKQSVFWQVKWHVRDRLLSIINPDTLRLVEIDERVVHKFLISLVREESPNLDLLATECLVRDLIKEFFTERPLVKVTILRAFGKNE
jgi:hypothetical protein